MNRVTHFQIPTEKPDKAMKFFNDVFGWTFQQLGPAEYWNINTGDDNAPGINGGLMRKRPGQPVTNSITVESLDTTLTKIEKHGGKIVVPKTSIPAMGYYAFFTDIDGNIHGLMENDVTAT